MTTSAGATCSGCCKQSLCLRWVLVPCRHPVLTVCGTRPSVAQGLNPKPHKPKARLSVAQGPMQVKELLDSVTAAGMKHWGPGAHWRYKQWLQVTDGQSLDAHGSD